MTTESLLGMFPPVRTEQWEQLIRETVPGPDYSARLIWHPEEGLPVRPYYRAEDVAGLEFPNAAPGEFPFVRGAHRMGGWLIREEVDAANPAEANRVAIDAVSHGAGQIAFRRARVESAKEIDVLLENLDETSIYFESTDQLAVRSLIERLKKRPHSAGVSADLDPLADLDFSAATIRIAVAGFKPLLIDAGAFNERAAGVIEEIGFALAAAVDFVNEMQDRGISGHAIADSIGFSFACGPEFFVHIAKLRAFRMVWAHALVALGGSQEFARTAVHARPARWNKTVYDRHLNIVRATTETISAILGGADSISTAPYDECCNRPDDSSVRLARNTQIILQREALLGRVADPVGGSYLIEALTNSIAIKAWKLFQELEAAGGYRKAKSAGIFSTVLERRVKSREGSAAARKLVLTGTNRFANLAEKISDGADVAWMDASPRIARSFERLRLRVERHEALHGRLPVIVLAEIGDMKMRRARSQFAADFIACSGLTSEIRCFDRVEQIATTHADLVVLCSSDSEYLLIAEQLMPMLRPAGSHKPVFIAGSPDCGEQLRNLGISGFIHLRRDAIEALNIILQKTGIKD